MTSTRLFELAQQVPAIPQVLRELKGRGLSHFNGVADAAKPFWVAYLAQMTGRNILLVTENLKRMERYADEIEVYLRLNGAPTRLLSFPDSEALPHEDILPPLDVIAERMQTLSDLLARQQRLVAEPCLVAATLQSLLQRTWAPAILRQQVVELELGKQQDPQSFVAHLELLGYEAEYRVNARGQISQRGGIVDVWSPDASSPWRIEFDGDIVDSLRVFEPVSQQSHEKIDHVVILPCGEIGLLKKMLTMERQTPKAILSALLDYLPSDTLIILDEMDDLESAASHLSSRIPEGDPFFMSWQELIRKLNESHRWRTVSLTGNADVGMPGKCQPDERSATSLEINSLDAYCRIFARPPSPDLAIQARKEFFSQIKRWCERGYTILAFCPTDSELQRFRELLTEFGIEHFLKGESERHSDAQISNVGQSSTLPFSHAHIQPLLGSLQNGFVWDAAKLVVVTDTEIFSRSRQHRPRRTRLEKVRASSQAIADFTELEEGDFVVHIQHGIGRYRGLKTIEVAGQKQEVLAIEYAEEARLYVPIDQAHLVSKYIGAGKRLPELNRLGGKRWSKQKADAQQAVIDLAAEMLEIQAARQLQEGYAFSPDTPWQRDFEAAFIYEETPDQLQTIEEIKADLESKRPMDRLICGDVGYGKTEVAIRAAFKAVMDNKQVAVLVPTTVLAEQHRNTFRDRMAGYPIVVEMLSRFRTYAEQQAVLKGLAEGSVDIVIGTHRLLQPDIHFRDLGLVIIDEEQRFGVRHKERLKQLRRMVDVLTLTATPIPRTLYLALTGARDMSQIQTPPQDRLPVKTFVMQYDERTVTDAIRRELSRGGQVYYLHNRVQTIEAVAQRLQQSIPEARIAVGHGQMHEDDLEDVMRRFVDGNVDVLVCTTIIESGLDIPNANTIIIDRADRFGLSDLYQLRGRVGRYKHQAYAYVLLPRHIRLIESARKRIAAIKQYSSLGSGFRIAMRDLEIRGAGNILGPQQSGHITAVGFDLYCQLLRESVAKLKGEPIKKLPHVEMRLDFLDLAVERTDSRQTVRLHRKDQPWVERQETSNLTACYIPYDYISETPLRIEVYRKIAQAVSESELRSLRQELRDRFGDVPAPVRVLLEVAATRINAAEAGMDLVETDNEKIKLSRRGEFILENGRFPRFRSTTAAGKLRELRKILRAFPAPSHK